MVLTHLNDGAHGGVRLSFWMPVEVRDDAQSAAVKTAQVDGDGGDGRPN